MTRLVQYPEFFIAKATLRREWEHRGRSAGVTTLGAFATQLKGEVEKQLYEGIVYRPTPERTLGEMERAINGKDFSHALGLLSQLSDSEVLGKAFQAASDRMWDQYQQRSDTAEHSHTR